MGTQDGEARPAGRAREGARARAGEGGGDEDGVEAGLRRIVSAVSAMVGLPYDGEPVDQLSHALQCAALARADGAPSYLVVAALLHDVARSPDVASEPYDSGRRDHGQRAEDWIEPLLGERIGRIAAAHVPAKRYLVAAEPGYAAGLSEVSRRTLEHQGGPMSEAEAAEFRAHPAFEDAIRLRRWDDLGKEPDAAVPPIDAYFEDLRAALRAQVDQPSAPASS